MATRYVPKNIKKYKPRLFWGFTSRQIISLVVAIVFIFICLKIMGDDVSSEVKVYVSSLPAVIPILIGFVEPYGIPLEEFIPEVFSDYLKNSPKRYRITAPSLHLTTGKQAPLKLDKKDKPLAVAKKK